MADVRSHSHSHSHSHVPDILEGFAVNGGIVDDGGDGCGEARGPGGDGAVDPSAPAPPRSEKPRERERPRRKSTKWTQAPRKDTEEEDEGEQGGGGDGSRYDAAPPSPSLCPWHSDSAAEPGRNGASPPVGGAASVPARNDAEAASAATPGGGGAVPPPTADGSRKRGRPAEPKPSFTYNADPEMIERFLQSRRSTPAAAEQPKVVAAPWHVSMPAAGRPPRTPWQPKKKANVSAEINAAPGVPKAVFFGAEQHRPEDAGPCSGVYHGSFGAALSFAAKSMLNTAHQLLRWASHPDAGLKSFAESPLATSRRLLLPYGKMIVERPVDPREGFVFAREDCTGAPRAAEGTRKRKNGGGRCEACEAGRSTSRKFLTRSHAPHPKRANKTTTIATIARDPMLAQIEIEALRAEIKKLRGELKELTETHGVMVEEERRKEKRKAKEASESIFVC